jgi:hypothetical protein
MNERRVLVALLLLAASIAFYFWGKQSTPTSEGAKPPEKQEAEERAKADPFPAAEGAKPAAQAAP